MEQIRKVAEAGADLVRVAVPRDKDAVALKTIVKRLADPGDRRHPLQPHPRAEGDRRRRPLHPPQPGQHRRPREGRRGRARRRPRPACRCGSASTRARCPSTCTSSSAQNPVEALVTRRGRVRRDDGVARLRELQGLDQVDERAEHDRRQPPARRADPLPDPPRHHRGGHEVVGLAEVRRRPRHAARRRGGGHDPDLPLDLPRRGGGQGRLGDPQGAAAARARPGADRLPDLRPPAVRHGHGRRRDRAAPGGLHRADRGRGARLRGERDRRGLARRLRHHRRQERGPDLRPRQAAAEGPPGRPRRRAVRARSTSRSTAARSRSTTARPPRAPSGCSGSRRRTPAS